MEKNIINQKGIKKNYEIANLEYWNFTKFEWDVRI
jgi:hypothetical protein